MALIAVRYTLAIAFLSAVADRLGLWGPKGTPSVDWGSPAGFVPAVAQLTPWLPTALESPIAWAITGLELALGVLLIVGAARFWTAVVTTLLLTVFGVSMAAFIGLKAPLNYSVFTAAAAAFLLAALERRVCAAVS